MTTPRTYPRDFLRIGPPSAFRNVWGRIYNVQREADLTLIQSGEDFIAATVSTASAYIANGPVAVGECLISKEGEPWVIIGVTPDDDGWKSGYTLDLQLDVEGATD